MLSFKFKKILGIGLLSLFLFAFSSVPVGSQGPVNPGQSVLDWNVTDDGGDDAQTTPGATDVIITETHDGSDIPNNELSNTNPEQESGSGDYELLEPLGSFRFFNSNSECPFVDYLNIIINIFLGICAVLAMIMIIVGGFEYMTSELPSVKGDGKEKVTNAIFGFVLALAAWVILNTLNPLLLNMCPSIPKARIGLVQANSINIKDATPGNIARCTPITNTSHPCHPQNLTQYFGNKAEDMSKICNVESGGNSDAESGTDKDVNGNPFSFGLFQINLLANGIYVGPECVGLFMTSSTNKTIPPAKYIKKGANGKYVYDAILKPGKEAQYNSCKEKLKDPATNLAIAKKLFEVGGNMNSKWGSMHAWMGDYSVCASAFD